MSGKRKRNSLPTTSKKKKQLCENVSKIFDSSDDELFQSSVLDMNTAQPHPPGAPSCTVDPSTSASRRPPPPPVDRPATSSDIDRLMSSIKDLTGSFSEVRADVSVIAGRLDSQATRLENLAREANTDRAAVVDLVRVVDERTDDLSQQLSEDR